MLLCVYIVCACIRYSVIPCVSPCINIDNVNTMKPTITYVRFSEIQFNGNMVITFEYYRKPSKPKPGLILCIILCTQVMEESLLIWGEGESINFLSTST